MLLAADVYRVGPDAVPANREDFIAALTSVSGDRYGGIFRMPGFQETGNMLYEALTEGTEGPLDNLLTKQVAIKWIPVVSLTVAAIVMLSEDRHEDYEQHLRPVLEKQATDSQSRRVVTALKHRIAGQEWRPPLPCDLTYLIITLVEEHLAYFLENRAEHAEQPAEADDVAD
jgi:hypothetical protein